MNGNHDILLNLFDKYENGQLSQEERLVFFQWYAEADFGEFEEIFQLYLQSRQHPSTLFAWPADAESAADRIGGQKKRLWERIASEEYAEEELTPPATIRKVNWLYWSAAAALVLLVIGWYMLKVRPAKTSAPSVEIVSIAPGGNKAILTLGNGSSIVLDSVANGALTSQGGTQLVKQDGLLAYHARPGAGTVLFNTVTTPRGGEYQLILPDGTHVWLNAASSIRYPSAFTATDRTVYITGEAYLEVAKDQSKPFRVEAAGIQVQVLGTAIDIMAYDDEAAVKTTLINGSVKVTAGGLSRLLHPGQQAAFDNNGSKLSLSSPDIEEVVAWKEGKFLFTNTSLQTIMRQIERWYDVDVTYTGNVEDIHFSGAMSRKQYAAQLLEILALDKRVRFVTKDRNVTVIPIR